MVLFLITFGLDAATPGGQTGSQPISMQLSKTK
jgi:hypothetical protein